MFSQSYSHKNRKGLQMIRGLWDKEAASTAPEYVRADFLRTLFIKIVNKGLAYLNNKDNIKMLKTDLWNESISTERNILNEYTGNNIEIYGMDISHYVCSHILDKRIKAVQGDIKKIPFKSQSMDIVLDLSTLDHIPIEEIEFPLGEYNRILKPGGIMVLIFDSWGFFWKAYNLYTRVIKKLPTNKFMNNEVDRQYIFNSKKVKKKVSRQFKILEEYSIDYFGWTWNRFTAPVWKKMPERIYNLIYLLELSGISKFLKFLAKQYVIIGRKL